LKKAVSSVIGFTRSEASAPNHQKLESKRL